MTSAAATVNHLFYPNCTFTFSVTLNDANGDPVDLTGYTALMHVRREKDDETPVLTLSTAASTITLGSSTSNIVGTLPATSTDIEVDPDHEIWYYDILLTNTSPNPDVVERKIQGCVYAYYGVTRP
jgi:hypothetical protein